MEEEAKAQSILADLVLFTRSQRVRELSYISRFIYYMRGAAPEDPEFHTDLVLPEALIVKVNEICFRIS